MVTLKSCADSPGVSGQERSKAVAIGVAAAFFVVRETSMRWFGRKAGRGSVRPCLLRGWSGVVPGEPWPRSYEAQVREAHVHNPVAQRAVRLVAEGVASATVFRADGKKDGPSTSSGRAVSLISSPVLEKVAAQLLLHGNGFVQILCDAEGEPAELFSLRPERVGDRRFRLSRLLRGRRGTEWAAGQHAIGETFLLIEAPSLALIEPPAGTLGGEVRLMAQGIGDAEAAVASRTITGEAMRPPSPVHLRAALQPNGDLRIEWVRRSRSGWVWASGTDTPLGEEGEAYRLVLAGAGSERVATLAEPHFTDSLADQMADGAAGAIAVSVVQIGTAAMSRPATIVIEQ